MASVPFIEGLERTFAFTPLDIKKTIKEFHSEMKLGLEGKKSSLKMIPSFVVRPKGSEKGRYLALDLGGTNLRILAAELNGRGKAKILAVDKFVIPKKLTCGTGEALFDHIAQCVVDFLNKEHVVRDGELDLGFTFSFPLEQTGIASGRLITWTKGFSAAGVVGKDVVVLLRKALAHKGLSSVKITALVNDTVGTLVTKSYSDRSCDMGVILGTGTNACYPEKKINKMIINIEWGDFAKLPRTPYDIELDEDSKNPGRQFLEKMVSGMYLGELARRIIFHKTGNKAFRKEYSFKTEQMSAIAVGNGKKDLRRICGIVSLRSARIAGMAICAVTTWMDPKLKYQHTVAIDGSLFEFYPNYKKNMRAVFKEMFGKKAKNIKLVLTKDGSGVGAAITAAIAGKNVR